MSNINKIVVTGGSGFIGTNVIKYANEKGYTVYNLDINQPKNSDHKIYWRNIDLRNYNSLLSTLSELQPTHILHLAADLGMDHNDLDNLQCNIVGIDNLIESVKAINSVQRIVFTSSLLVCENGYVPNSDTDYCPPNFYGKSKVIGEEKVRSSNLKCEWVIVRPTSIWGPWFEHSYKTFFQTIDKNSYMHLGVNEFQKPASFVGNAVHMMLQILFRDNPDINGKTFYLADYKWYSTREWAIIIQNTLNSKKIKTAPLWFIKVLATAGDLLKKIFRIEPPITSFRLKNMLTGGAYPVENTKDVVGKLPYDLNESVYLTAKWMYENNMIKHKPEKI